MTEKPTEKITVTSCRFCILAGEKTCNYDNDIFIDYNIIDDSMNESCPLNEQSIVLNKELKNDKRE